MPSSDLHDRLFVQLQHVLPKQALTRFAEFVAKADETMNGKEKELMSHG